MRKNIEVRVKVVDQAMDIQSILDSCGCAALLNKALRGTFQRENNRTIDFVCGNQNLKALQKPGR